MGDYIKELLKGTQSELKDQIVMVLEQKKVYQNRVEHCDNSIAELDKKLAQVEKELEARE